MQMAFFLLPKNETLHLAETMTLRQAMEKMQYHGYGAVPVLNEAGQYIGTITAADILWHLKDAHNANMSVAEKIFVQDVPRRHDNIAVSVSADIRNMLKMAMEENFIPIVDDLGVFIGIVRRREIMEFYQKHHADWLRSLDARGQWGEDKEVL
ncbi:MAG: CBS domain-containing protein [Firmicutes bacterium]|nr:CBS domain-containing protein [Bacillota bacterium]